MDNLNGVMHTYRSPYESFDNNATPCFGIDIGTENQSQFPNDYFYQAQSYVDNQPNNQFDQSQIIKCNECGMLFESAFILKEHADRYHRFPQNANEAAEILDLDSHKVHVYQPPAPPIGVPSPQSPSTPIDWSTFNGAASEAAKTDAEQPKTRERNASGRTSEGGRPKTYSCEPCGKWFTSNGHLKRHFNTTLHKNATKSLNKEEPQEVENKVEEVFSVPENNQWLMPQNNELQQFNYQNYQPIDQMFNQPQYYQQGNGHDFQQKVENDMFNRPVQNNYYQMPMKPEQNIQSFDVSNQQQFYSNGVNQFNNNNIIKEEEDSKIDFIKDSSNDDNSINSDEEAPESKLVEPVKKKQESNATGSFKCTQCDKVFNRICYLTQHNNTFHKGDKPFKCHLCGKRFQNADLFDQHQQKHAGDKPYKCSLCPKQFNHKTDLRRHMCLHTGQKPFLCQICNKGFIRKDHMVKHAQTHTKRSALHQAAA